MNKGKLEYMVDTDVFSWGVTEPRSLVQAIAMTAADLCASSKPWEIQLETVNVIFLEFYEQGREGHVPFQIVIEIGWS